jgi:hypothetical protein
MKNFITVCFVIFIALSGPGPALATLITVEFTGEINKVEPELGSFFSIGDPMTATLIYDSLVTAAGGGPHSAYYLDAIMSLSFTVGSLSGVLFSSTNEIDVRQANVDGIAFWAGFTPSTSFPGFLPHRISFSLTDWTGAVFDSLALPTSIELSDFNNSGWTISFRDLGSGIGYYAHAGGKIFGTSPRPPPPTPAPEPTSIALISLGLAGLIFARRKIKT